MLFSEGNILTDRTAHSVETAIRHIGNELTLVSILLQTNTAVASFFSIAVTAFTDDPAKNESRLIENITADTKKATELFHLIVEGTVTPCTLTDVLEDLL